MPVQRRLGVRRMETRRVLDETGGHSRSRDLGEQEIRFRRDRDRRGFSFSPPLFRGSTKVRPTVPDFHTYMQGCINEVHQLTNDFNFFKRTDDEIFKEKCLQLIMCF